MWTISTIFPNQAESVDEAKNLNKDQVQAAIKLVDAMEGATVEWYLRADSSVCQVVAVVNHDQLATANRLLNEGNTAQVLCATEFLPFESMNPDITDEELAHDSAAAFGFELAPLPPFDEEIAPGISRPALRVPVPAQSELDDAVSQAMSAGSARSFIDRTRSLNQRIEASKVAEDLKQEREARLRLEELVAGLTTQIGGLANVIRGLTERLDRLEANPVATPTVFHVPPAAQQATPLPAPMVYAPPASTSSTKDDFYGEF